MIKLLEKIFVFVFFSSFLFSEENKNLKSIFSEHYFELFSISEDLAYYKYIFLIKSLKDKVFCDSIDEKDEKIIIKRSDLFKKEYFYEREKLVRKMNGKKEEYKYGIGFGKEMILIPSNYVPDEDLKNVFLIKKQVFLNCEGENLDKFELSKKICTEFYFEYYIFSNKDKIGDGFCFKLFSFYDEEGRGSVYFPSRRVKFFGVLLD